MGDTWGMKLGPMMGAAALVMTLAGGAFADEAPPRPIEKKPVPTEATPTEVAPQPEVKRLPNTRPTRLPDGVFFGTLDGIPGAEIRITIVAGRVTEGVIRRPGGLASFDLMSVESGDSIELRLQGSVDKEFIRINGAFFDAERGAGRYDGVIGRKQTQGTWLLARR